MGRKPRRCAFAHRFGGAGAGRDPTHVTLVAVSKGQPLEAVRAVHALGVKDFGENYPQEALPKIAALERERPDWHFIGQVQSNKTRPIATHFAWVHSIDRLAVARRLSEQRPYHAAATAALPPG